MTSGKIQTSLTTKLLWLIVIVSTVLVLLTSAIEIAQERSDLIQTEKQEAQTAVSANRDALSLALWSFDQRALEITARSLVHGTSIFRVEVLDNGQTRLRLDRASVPEQVDFSWQIPLYRPNTHETIGVLRISETYVDIIAKVERRAGALIVTELIKILALSALLFFVIHRWITRPLSVLAARVEDIATKDTSADIIISRPAIGGHDEIDALVDAVNFTYRERGRMEAEQRRLQAHQAQSGKLQALGQMAGGVAHDFNNILGAILGFGRLLADDVPVQSLQQHFVQRILAACERGKELVEQVLAFARGGRAERRALDLRQVVHQCEPILRASFSKNTHAQFMYGDEELPVLGSESRLGQLIANLGLNANEALSDKPGNVTVEIGRALLAEIAGLKAQGPGERLLGTVDEARAYVYVRVSDTGDGIAPEILDRVFEPFFTTKGRQHGTGLGLAVVHGVVESHGGACHVQSRAGAGTVFSVYLPMTGEGIAAAPKAKPAVDLRGHERILIVDDEADIVDALSLGLERLGYETVGVNDPLEALEAFTQDPAAFDIVITDQVMPQMRGLELIAKIRAIRPDIKILLCTGYSDNIDETTALAAGADTFHIKPVDAAVLAASLRRLSIA